MSANEKAYGMLTGIISADLNGWTDCSCGGYQCGCTCPPGVCGSACSCSCVPSRCPPSPGVIGCNNFLDW